jgi:ATP-dependent RNA helicase DDX31/DBP7
MRDGASRGVKDVKLRELGVEDVLMDGFGGVGREYETRATDVQMGFERWVGETDEVRSSSLPP